MSKNFYVVGAGRIRRNTWRGGEFSNSCDAPRKSKVVIRVKMPLKPSSKVVGHKKYPIILDMTQGLTKLIDKFL